MKVVAVIIALAVTGCGGGGEVKRPTPKPLAASPAQSAQPSVTPDAPFRAHPPAPNGTVSFVAPKIKEARLKNGVRVLTVERHDLPIVSARLVVRLGAGDLPDVRPGLASFVGSMMEQGTERRTALELSDQLEASGADVRAWIDWDSANVSLKVLTERLDIGLDLMADVALHPTFPDGEIARLRARRITAIQAEKSNPSSIAANALSAAIFGRAHPYGHSLWGEEQDAKAFARRDVARVYGRIFSPENATLVVAGDVESQEIVSKLEASFGRWKRSTSAATPTPPPRPAKRGTDKRVVFVDRAGPQSQIQVARVGVPYSVKDREAFLVTNAILGGMFSSRVNLNLREKNAYTYGARSYFAMRHGAGPFVVSAAVHAEKTGPALKEVMHELESLRAEGPTQDELALAKESIRLSMPGRFEGVAEVAGALAELAVYDLPLDDYEQRLVRLDRVTASDVKAVAVDWLSSDAMTFVVVGERATVAPQLSMFGERDDRDEYGNPLSRPVGK